MKTQILKRAILALLMAVTAATASAYSFEVDGIYYNCLTHDVLRDYGTVEVTYKDENYNSYSGSVTIPSYVYHKSDKFDVVRIGNDAFSDCDNLTSVTISERVKEIGSYAFYGCTGLKSVKIQNIGYWCRIEFSNSFSNPLYYAHHLYLNDTEITDLEIPNYVTEIGDDVFTYCTALKSVTIPNSVTKIGSSTFAYCSGLKSVTIGNSVTKIGSCAFYYCTGLKSVTIPNSVTSIGSQAFVGCTGLNSVTIGNSVTEIGDYAFSGCTGLTSVKISDIASWCNINFKGDYDDTSNPLYYAHHLYLGNTEITNLVIPNSATKIRRRAFINCTELKSVTIGNSVTSIGDYAFYKCTGLTSVTIGNSVTAILRSPFSGCDNITNLTSYAEAPPQCGNVDPIGTMDRTRCTLYVPAESIELYRTISPWNSFKNIKATNNAGIEDIVVDDDHADCPIEVYSIQGVKVGDSTDGLAPGTYIVKQGRSITKQVIQ